MMNCSCKKDLFLEQYNLMISTNLIWSGHTCLSRRYFISNACSAASWEGLGLDISKSSKSAVSLACKAL